MGLKVQAVQGCCLCRGDILSVLWYLRWGLEESNEELEKKAEDRGQVTK